MERRHIPTLASLFLVPSHTRTPSIPLSPLLLFRRQTRFQTPHLHAVEPLLRPDFSLPSPKIAPHFKTPLSPQPGSFLTSLTHNPSPPFALSFRKTKGKSRILAVSDEEGFVSYYDSKKHLHYRSSCWDKTAKERVFEWAIHENAIFDICWIKNDSHLLTTFGDQVINMWNAERRKCIGLLTRHAGSVKSVSPHVMTRPRSLEYQGKNRRSDG